MTNQSRDPSLPVHTRSSSARSTETTDTAITDSLETFNLVSTNIFDRLVKAYAGFAIKYEHTAEGLKYAPLSSEEEDFAAARHLEASKKEAGAAAGLADVYATEKDSEKLHTLLHEQIRLTDKAHSDLAVSYQDAEELPAGINKYIHLSEADFQLCIDGLIIDDESTAMKRRYEEFRSEAFKSGIPKLDD